MIEHPRAVAKFRLQNFKAIRDSGTVNFTPLTVLVGNNGVGKSSLIEGLEVISLIARDGLDKAFRQWRGFEYVWNRRTLREPVYTESGREYFSDEMVFKVDGGFGPGSFNHDVTRTYHVDCSVKPGSSSGTIVFGVDTLSITHHSQPTLEWNRDDTKTIVQRLVRSGVPIQELSSSRSYPNDSVLAEDESFGLWQFVRLNPEAMAKEQPVSRVGGYLPLAVDGSNVAEYLLEIHKSDPNAIMGIVETIQTVLPYLVDLKSKTTSELGRSAYLQLRERDITLPSWMFSTGTLRLMALLALFRNPLVPPLIVIEEIENGLDPRSIALIVDEIRELVRTGKSQVILTTHSPYLLDLVPLESLMFVERVEGETVFSRPADDESVQKWSSDFAPGRLYTMGRFRSNK